jgi:hypothetical protein
VSDLDLLDSEPELVALGHVVDPFAPPPKCQHRTFGLDCFSAVINDERGEIDKREVRVRVRCMACGAAMAIEFDKIRRPKDGEPHGIVLVLDPVED